MFSYFAYELKENWKTNNKVKYINKEINFEFKSFNHFPKRNGLTDSWTG